MGWEGCGVGAPMGAASLWDRGWVWGGRNVGCREVWGTHGCCLDVGL